VTQKPALRKGERLLRKIEAMPYEPYKIKAIEDALNEAYRDGMDDARLANGQKELFRAGGAVGERPDEPRTEAGLSLALDVARLLGHDKESSYWDARVAKVEQEAHRFGKDEQWDEVRPILREAGGAVGERHRDYAGRTCTTGLLHSHEGERPLDVERLRQACINTGHAIQVVAGNIDERPSFAAIVAEYARLSVNEGEPDEERKAHPLSRRITGSQGKEARRADPA